MKVKNIKLLTRNLLYVLPERKKSQKQSVALFTHRPLNYDFILMPQILFLTVVWLHDSNLLPFD